MTVMVVTAWPWSLLFTYRKSARDNHGQDAYHGLAMIFSVEKLQIPNRGHHQAYWGPKSGQLSYSSLIWWKVVISVDRTYKRFFTQLRALMMTFSCLALWVITKVYYYRNSTHLACLGLSFFQAIRTRGLGDHYKVWTLYREDSVSTVLVTGQ